MGKSDSKLLCRTAAGTSTSIDKYIQTFTESSTRAIVRAERSAWCRHKYGLFSSSTAPSLPVITPKQLAAWRIFPRWLDNTQTCLEDRWKLCRSPRFRSCLCRKPPALVCVLGRTATCFCRCVFYNSSNFATDPDRQQRTSDPHFHKNCCSSLLWK